jgi:hypothetical protein
LPTGSLITSASSFQWVRPPNINLASVSVPTSNAVNTNSSSGLTINVDLQISVANPNWFSANFKEIKAVARYPGTNTNNFGGGQVNDIKSVASLLPSVAI